MAIIHIGEYDPVAERFWCVVEPEFPENGRGPISKEVVEEMYAHLEKVQRTGDVEAFM